MLDGSREPADDNPFLAHFYSDPERFAFPAQMFYLASRSQQQNNLRQNRLFTNYWLRTIFLKRTDCLPNKP